jgi:hypothetical protein
LPPLPGRLRLPLMGSVSAFGVCASEGSNGLGD